MNLTRDRLAEVERLNELPINQAALNLLPPDWQDGTCLHVLALALWALEEGGLRVRRLSPTFPDTDEVATAVVYLMESDPAGVMRWLLAYVGYEEADGT